MKRFTVWAARATFEVRGEVVWIPAGQAIQNRDGSLNVYLDVLPIDGKLTLREKKVNPMKSEDES